MRDVFKLPAVLFFAAIVSVAALPGRCRAESGITQEEQAVIVVRDIRQNYLASLRKEALRTKNAPSKNVSASPGLWLTRVNSEEVNMATNRYEKKAQEMVELNGKVYYATGEGCAVNMRLNPSIRFAKDPMTGKTVDKSEAITYADASARVFYFATDTAYRSFIALADKETAYGYTAPR